MKKILVIFTVAVLLITAVYGSDTTKININGVEFDLSEKYQNGETLNNSYRVEDEFSITDISDNVENQYGFWKSDSDNSSKLTVDGRAVEFTKELYKGEYSSHVFFTSGDKIFMIYFKGSEITPEIEKLITNTPKSDINSDTFYNILDDALTVYKKEKVEKLNYDAIFNENEARLKSNYDDSSIDNKYLLYYYNSRRL